ncbi:dihydroorotase [Aliterella atlantica]|uniref:Dihydroorotase n=1 Tax=Aliterella atlantica CENA595 TaxID=1618023 RepID=A0A0D8ZWJ3_9CYAN|nr:dihydroorotase [Aliterella atlantica]KJH72799.1 dihydroorotase [Aliterella atlantica CENA595]
MISQVLQQVRVIDPVSHTDRIADVWIANGVIKAVEDKIDDVSAETQLRDCQGLVLGPGLVDLYSHSGEPGFEERENIASLMAAATAGGFTRLCILPDTTPPIDTPAGVASIDRIKGGVKCIAPLPLHIYVWGALTAGIQGQQMTQLAELAASGIVGFSDGQPIENLALLRRLLEYLQPLNKPIALWCCDRRLVGNGVIRECADSIILGLPGNPEIAETTAIAALLELVAAIGTPVHIMRVSTARSVELIAQAKQRGLPITASVSWIHLLLDTRSLDSYSPDLRIEPPLGNQTDRVAIIEAVRLGVIDAIAIDHSPYTYEEKTVAFAEAPPGAIGLELALALLWQNLVENGQLSALELWRCLSMNPAKCLQQNVVAISANSPAELTLFDPQLTWRVEHQALKSLSTNTPWLGQQITGRVMQTWVSNTRL